jgi:preprotein translocase subunit SecA
MLAPVERNLMLQVVDSQWKDHLYSLDHLKEGIGLRGYGQRDPLVEYKKESFSLFQAMQQRVEEEIVRYLWRLRPVFGTRGDGSDERAATARAAAVSTIFSPPRPNQIQENRPAPAALSAPPRAAATAGGIFGGTATAAPPAPARVGGDDAAVRTVRRDEPKVGRNDPCPCGSGKKYKKCHGAGL